MKQQHRMSVGRVTRLVSPLREQSLSPLLQSGWKLVAERDAIQKTFNFKDFHQAWSFMSRAVPTINQEDHHPEWFNVYSKVDIVLTTHDCSGLSEKDIRLASLFDKIQTEISQGKNQ